ncbi:MAG: LamG domain-containing protein [Puia sp.]|nr:LamG domain-containing protein [Puia sp.]
MESVLDSTDFVKPGGWSTVVYTYDGTFSKIYVNGQLKGTYHGTANFTANTNDIYIGATENPSAPYWLNGVIDEIRIYKKALCATAVQQLNNLKE